MMNLMKKILGRLLSISALRPSSTTKKRRFVKSTSTQTPFLPKSVMRQSSVCVNNQRTCLSCPSRMSPSSRPWVKPHPSRPSSTSGRKTSLCPSQTSWRSMRRENQRKLRRISEENLIKTIFGRMMRRGNYTTLKRRRKDSKDTRQY